MNDVAQSEKLAEAHDQRPPAARINAVFIAIHANRRINMHAYDTHLDCNQVAAPQIIRSRERMRTFEHRFQLNGDIRLRAAAAPDHSATSKDQRFRTWHARAGNPCALCAVALDQSRWCGPGG